MSLPFRFSIQIIFVLFIVFVFSNGVSAQIAAVTGWEVVPVTEDRHKVIFTAFKAGNVEADRAGLDTFFDKFYFARWTRPENLDQVQAFARDFLTDLSNTNGNAREYLLTKSFETFKKIIADSNTTPVSRYNAVLTIGQLVQKEPANRGLPPVPYAPALPYLVAEYKKAENPKFIQLGALIGIVRFAYIGIADETMKTTTIPALFIETIQSGKPKQDVSKDDQEEIDWFRLLALDGLGGLKSIGANGNVVKVLSEVIENGQEVIEVRTKAARMLGELNYEEADTSVNYQQLGTMLIALLKEIGDSQLQMVTQLRDKARVSKGNVSGPQDISMASSLPSTSSMEIELEFASLLPEQQLEITGAVQSIKANILNVVYAIRGSRFIGTANSGILPKLPADDPVIVKLNITHTKAVIPLFKILDEGLPEDKNKKTAAMGPSSEMMMDSSSSTSRTKPKDEKQLKVNFTIVQGALQTFCDELAKIIAGKY